EGVPRTPHSMVNLLDFLRHRVAPPIPASLPALNTMEWWFDDERTDEDHEMRLYLVLSDDYYKRTKRFGIEHHVFEEEPLVDDVTFERIRLAKQYELENAFDPHTKAALQIEHKQQVAWLRDQKIGITVADFMAFPYRKLFPDRLQMMRGQQKVQKY